MIIALSLAALFLVNNASMVYAYENQIEVPEFTAVATIENDKGESYDLEVTVETVKKLTNTARGLTNSPASYEAIASVAIPYSSTLQELYSTDSADSSIVARVHIYFYLDNSYANSEIGIKVTHVGCTYTLAGDGSVLNRIYATYACNGPEPGPTGDPVLNQSGSTTKYSAFQIATGFSHYVSRDDSSAVVYAQAKYYMEDMHNSWVTTVRVDP